MAKDEAYGASGLDGLTQAAETLKVKVTKTVRYATGPTPAPRWASWLTQTATLWCLVTPNDTGSIVTKMSGRNFAPRSSGSPPRG